MALWAIAWNVFQPTFQQAMQRIDRERLLAERGLREYLLVELLYVNSSTGTLCAYVSNTGDVSSEVVSLYLNGSLAWSGYAPLRAGEAKPVCTGARSTGTYNVRVCSYTNCFEVRDYVVP